MNEQRRAALLLVSALAFPTFFLDKPARTTPAVGPGDALAKPAKPWDEVVVQPHDHLALLTDHAGAVLWSTRLDGNMRWVRPPNELADADRVYVSHGDGVTALDRQTGKVLWHTEGPAQRMCLSGGLLLAADCGYSYVNVARGRLLTARAVATGAEVFRVQLSPENFDPLPIEEVAGLFLVQTDEDLDGKGEGLLVDRDGRVRCRFDRQVVAGTARGEDRVFLTSRDVVCVSADGRTRWAVPFGHGEWFPGGGLVGLPGGHLLAFLYGRNADTGVQVVRLDPADGRAVWAVSCAPACRLLHSAYDHWAALAVEGRRVKVTSRGSGGTFVEVLGLRTGGKVGRWQSGGGPP